MAENTVDIDTCSHEHVCTNSNGEQVCSTCGLVIDDFRVVPEVRHWKRTHERNSFAITHINSTVPNRLKRLNDYAPISKAFNSYLMYIYDIQRIIGFSNNVKTDLVHIMKKELRDRGTKNMYAFIFAAAVIIGRQHGELIPIKSMQKIPKMRKRKPGNCLKNIAYIKAKYGYYMNRMDKNRLLNNIIQRLKNIAGFGDEVAMLVLHEAVNNLDKIDGIGGDPIGINAALVYIVAKNWVRVTQNMMHAAVNVQPVTLRRNIRIIKKRFN